MKKKELINDTNGHKIKDSFVIVSVKDNVTGIDEAILPKLITKFASKSHVDTGLGLYLSKNIIEDHGDKIWMVITRIAKMPLLVLVYLYHNSHTV